MKNPRPTQYKLERFDNSSWVRVVKGIKVDSLAANDEAALQRVWKLEGSSQNHFYVADKDGMVSIVTGKHS